MSYWHALNIIFNRDEEILDYLSYSYDVFLNEKTFKWVWGVWGLGLLGVELKIKVVEWG